MPLLLLILSLLLMVSPLAYSQQQYSEGACILLAQQIDRFSQQKQSSNYRSARREYDRFCLQPATRRPAVVKTLPDSTAVDAPAPATKAMAEAAAVSPDTAEGGFSSERQDSTERQDRTGQQDSSADRKSVV